MNLITKSVPFLWWLLAPMLVAKLFILILLLLTEDIKEDISISLEQKSSYLYAFPKFFKDEVNTKVEPKKVYKKQRLGNIKLKACYIEKNREFIIIKDGAKTVFIDLKNSYKNAKLITITRDSALFLRNGEYIELTLAKKTTASKDKETKTDKTAVQVSSENYISVKRHSFKKYTQNPQQALRDIRFSEIKKDKQFSGLKLSFVRRGSLFDKMNLKKGDIIKTIDGKELKSIMSLLPYYNLLENSTTLSIGFERDGNKKEITYEIN